MSMIDDAKNILTMLKMPLAQTSELCCLTLLALAGINDNNQWKNSTNEWMRIHDIIQYITAKFGIQYAENTRETIRKNAIHHLRTATIIEDNGKATNSPNYSYRLTKEALFLLKKYGKKDWNKSLKHFQSIHASLLEIYSSKKKAQKVPICVNNNIIHFSPREHSQLLKHIIEEFAPRFAPYSECLYMGDTAKKDLIINTDKLIELGFIITVHDKLPDVILYNKDKMWIYFVEAVKSVGPMNPKRIHEIQNISQNVSAGKIFVSAFPDFQTYKKFANILAWDTEVWIAKLPEHLIHLNGNDFLKPRKH
ncbi:MAG: restriction endonuclease [Deltaproteobacteria bacterium]|jgi:hypothetical protein|nr:restriction endonuclease [Deltaproteobacteria bacterium]